MQRDVDAIVRTVEKTRDWLAAVSESVGRKDEQHAWLCLRAVLHALRDRLPLETLAHVSAQLPMLIRGVLFEGWDPTGKPEKLTLETFVTRVQKEALLESPAEAETAIRAVANVLWDHLTDGLMTHVAETLPAEFNQLLYS